MSKNCFEIGLVGAGAVSAGAYTGGVLDFLVEALDAWYGAKESGADGVPSHDVRLSVFSGASAGAVTAALGAGYLGSDQPPIRTPADAESRRGENKLYDAWVDRIDIRHLLGDRDLQGDEARVLSLLDSSILRDIADDGLNLRPRTKRRPYLADDFHLFLTLTNLRGVPYAIPLESGGAGGSHAMSLHADYAHFCLSEEGGRGGEDATCLSWKDLSGSIGAEQLKLAALSSSAFPVGLAPQMMTHYLGGSNGRDCYSSREWPVPLASGENADDDRRCTRYMPIPVDWGDIGDSYDYRFLCVDGGVMNNEPLELARKRLAGEKQRNPRGGTEADKAVLMIDPFPSEIVFDPDYAPPKDLFGLVMSLFTALKNQSRFKPDELMLAAYDGNYSRYLIAPKRGEAEHPIACGSLGGFGGFLKHEFRRHDFFLGRRNAQAFLRRHFVLPEDNSLFDADRQDKRMFERFCVKDVGGSPVLYDGKRLLPVIPVVGNAGRNCVQLDWPVYEQSDLDGLSRGIEQRLQLVLDKLVDQYFKGHRWYIRKLAKIAVRAKKDDLARWALQVVENDLKRMGLMK